VLLTMGAGARIGLVTGLIAVWLSFAVSGASLYMQRYVFHQGARMDHDWQEQVNTGMELIESSGMRQWMDNASHDPAGVAEHMKSQAAWMLSPEGHAGVVFGDLLFAELLLLVFAVAGGALGAKFMTRARTKNQA
jgi:hypothetical protein